MNKEKGKNGVYFLLYNFIVTKFAANIFGETEC